MAECWGIAETVEEDLKLGLGTVQFGLDYGVSNKGGQTSLEEARRILSCAAENGIQLVDTASHYGESEAVLGRSIGGQDKFHIVTKTPGLRKQRIGRSDIGLLEDTFCRSMANLRCDHIWGLLVWHAGDLLAPGGGKVYEWMLKQKENGRVGHIGVSIYAGREIDEVLANYDIDFAQVPINVLDRRLLHGGQLQRMRNRHVEIHARSAFLQGLLLMDPTTLPSFFDPIRSHLAQYHAMLSEDAISTVGGALLFLRQLEMIDVCVLGVNSRKQLAENIEAFVDAGNKRADFERFEVTNEDMINPARWPS